MPTFFFNTADHLRDRDEGGTQLPDAAHARTEAIAFAGACVRDNPELLRDDNEFRVEVNDETGALIFIVSVRATTPVSAPQRSDAGLDG